MKFDVKNTKYYLVFVVIIFAIFSLWHYTRKTNLNYPIRENLTGLPDISNIKLQYKKNNYTDVIRSQAEIMRQALIDGDYKTFIKYNYPKVIELMGGEKNLIQILEKSNTSGYKLIAVSLGDVSDVVSSGSQLQAVISQIVVVRVDDGNKHGRLLTKSSLVAISDDKGKNWTFVDTSGKNLDIIKSIIPSLSSKLVIPQMSQPVFYPSPSF